MSITFYHNPRCSKSRQALALLESNGMQPDVVLYMDEPPTPAALKAVLQKLGYSARQLLRTGEAEYADLGLANTALSDDDLIAAMCSHPRLIERPIAITGKKAVVGRPPENVLDLLP